MKILVLSDIHSNITALESVLADAGEFDGTWCLGDIVGYGPDPNECIQKLLTLPHLECVLGNHDAAALGAIPIDNFNHDARMSILWLRSKITTDSREYLSSLLYQVVLENVYLVHGSPRSPLWEYILDRYTAMENFEYFQTKACFVGHTHMPAAYEEWNYNNVDGDHVTFKINRPDEFFQIATKTIINPGSVGQPRDHDYRASYAIYDTDALTWTVG